MKIDFSQKLVNPNNGEPVLKSEDNKEPATLGSVCVEVLQATLIGADGRPEQMTGEKKLELFNLSMKVREGEQDVTPEEVTIIRERIGKMYPTVIVGITYPLLDK